MGGLLVAYVGIGWCFLIDGVSYIAVLAALAMMRDSELRLPPRTARARGQVRAGLRYVRSVVPRGRWSIRIFMPAAEMGGGYLDTASGTQPVVRR